MKNENENTQLFSFSQQIIDLDDVDKRLDQYLAERFSDFSRARWQQAIKDKHVLLNHAPCKANTRLKFADTIQGEITLNVETPHQAQAIDLDVLYCDDEMIIINKPAGMVVHPAPANHDSTLLNALLHAFPKTQYLPRAGIVHRLDKDTSGVLVIAHSLKAYQHLITQLQARTMGREYLALVYRHLSAGGTVDAPIGRNPKDRLKMALRPDGKEAITHYRIAKQYQYATLLNVALETGRTHQIRVHMKSIHHPLVGDKVYDSNVRTPAGVDPFIRQTLADFPRQALHAHNLHLIHPKTEELCNFSAPLAPDFQALLTTLDEHQLSDSND